MLGYIHPKYRGTEKELKINPQTGLYEDFPLGENNYEESPNGHRKGNFWIPAECDFPLRKGWFWHPEGHGRHTPAQLVDLYFRSVGLNSCMDIGIAPDRRGLIDEYDEKLLREFGDRIDAIFKTNLALQAKVSASNVRGKSKEYAASNVIAGKSKFNQYWAADDEINNAELILEFPKANEFSVVSLREPIQFGHRIDRWALDAWQNGEWTEFASGNAIGARRLWRGQPITSKKIRLRLINAMASPAISEFAVYLEPETSRKESKSIASLFKPGMDKSKWTIISPNKDAATIKQAIDNNPGTFYYDQTSEKNKREMIVDMHETVQVKGFLYTPRQDHKSAGNITHYSFSVSADGKNWIELSRGEFSNIKANPIQQEVTFHKLQPARYFKLSDLSNSEDGFNISEIGIINQ